MSTTTTAMISIDDFAAARGISTRTVRRWLDSDRIPGAVMVGGKWALPADAAVQQSQPAAAGSAVETAGHVRDTSHRGQAVQLTVQSVLAPLPVMLPLDVAARVLGVSEYALRRNAEYFQLQRLGAHGSYVMPKARVRELEG